MEVLVSIGIVAIGLVSVLSLLPVGGYQAAEANKNERKATLGQNAVQDLKNRGVLDPKNWMAFNTQTNQWVSYSTLPQSYFDYLPPLVIDPQMTSAAQNIPGDYPTLSRFPANGLIAGSPFVPSPTQLTPIQIASGNPPPPFYRWLGMTRCTLSQACIYDSATSRYLPSGPLSQAICVSADDKFANRPTDASMPAESPYTSDSSTGIYLKRDFEGNYSWLITLTPTHIDEIEHVVPAPKRQYLMSLVIFDRRLTATIPTPGSGQEEMVYARHAAGSTGLGGGDFDLGDRTPYAESKLEMARPGNWLMLCRYEPTGNPAVPVWPTFNWYRIVTATESAMGQIQVPDITGSMTTMLGRSVTLSGPDWPRATSWPAANSITWPSQISDANLKNFDTYACLFENIIAVYQRPIWLEGPSPWSQ